MKTRLLTGIIGAAMMLLTPLFAQDDKKPSPSTPERSVNKKSSGMSEDMRQAIAWEHAKDRAAERQARIETRRPGGEHHADRVVVDKDSGRKVKDTKAPGVQRDK